MQNSSSRPYGWVTVAPLRPQDRTYTRDCHVRVGSACRLHCTSSPSPSLVLRPDLLVLQGRSTLLVLPLLYCLCLSCKAAMPSLPSWPETLAVVALLHRGGRGPAPSSADGRAALQLSACKWLRPCSMERQQLLTLQITACRRPWPCAVERQFISSGFIWLLPIPEANAVENARLHGRYWHPAYPASFLQVRIPCSPSKYSRGLPARLHGRWRALWHHLRQGTLPSPRLAS